ncbi:MAG: triose-phosphate isomerase, partial [Chlamydiales bacterium]|nr:triose-phosphate isomerase [Chlamydiales bacterium]
MIAPLSQYNFWCFVQRKIIAGNWKMHKTFAEAKSFMKEFRALLPPSLDCRVLLAPSFPLLGAMVEWAEGTVLEIGVQNIHDQEQGAFTGEVSASLVKGMGARFTLIGHSERRQLFHEKGDWIQKKIRRALISNLQPILCIGETLEERESGQMEKVLQKQLLEALEGFSSEEVSKIVIAYEPVWAIGTGKHATP